MSFDLLTGIELENLLPEGMDRLQLASRIAERLGGRVEEFIFPSKVPVPSLPGVGAEATIALIQDIARHHQARVQAVSPDYQFFYLAHRAGRVIDAGGRLSCSIVHDNTLAGGERVAEVVTAPLLRAEMPWLARLVELLRDIDGCTVPESGAMHVHLDGHAFRDTAVLARLVSTYVRFEPLFRALAGTTAAMRRAGSLPEALRGELEILAGAGAPWEEARLALARHIESRSFGLNLYNLIAGDPNKLTVELKLARGTLDPRRAIALRELWVALAAKCIEGGSEDLAAGDEAELLAALELPTEHARVLLEERSPEKIDAGGLGDLGIAGDEREI